MPPIRGPYRPVVKTDTSQRALELQASVLRKLSPAARLDLAIEMSATARELLRSRLQQAHPEWSQQALEREMLRYIIPEAPLTRSSP